MNKITTIILDCETIDKSYNFICDLAWANVYGKTVEVKNYIIKEHLELMATGSFSGSKTGKTLAEVAKGNAIIAPYAEIIAELTADMLKTTYVMAFNAGFDKRKVIDTAKVLQVDTSTIEGMSEKWRDLWAWASKTIMFKKSYIDFCEVNGYITDAGNPKTSAEIVIKFLRKDTSYVEEHTARADVLDELEIYRAIKAEFNGVYRKVLAEETPEYFEGCPWHNVAQLKKALNS